MSKRGIIQATPPDICEFCLEKRELRPYGPSGENICFECGMKDKKMTERRFNQHVLGEGFDA